MTTQAPCAGEEAPQVPGMVWVTAGEFIMGTDDGFQYETPARRVYLTGFYIDRYEVTNVQYKRFIDSTEGVPPPHWKDRAFRRGEENFPVTNVSYYDALRYARWAGKRLPTEEEWEKAARGGFFLDGDAVRKERNTEPDRLYPWGYEWNKKYANVKPLFGFGGPKATGSYPDGVSPYGCYDMCGNVWEWTVSWFGPYPGNAASDSNFGEKYKVIRSGSFRHSETIAQTARRDFMKPEAGRIDVGFRCTK